MCSFSMSFLAKDFPHCSQAWLFTPTSKQGRLSPQGILTQVHYVRAAPERSTSHTLQPHPPLAAGALAPEPSFLSLCEDPEGDWARRG